MTEPNIKIRANQTTQQHNKPILDHTNNISTDPLIKDIQTNTKQLYKHTHNIISSHIKTISNNKDVHPLQKNTISTHTVKTQDQILSKDNMTHKKHDILQIKKPQTQLSQLLNPSQTDDSKVQIKYTQRKIDVDQKQEKDRSDNTIREETIHTSTHDKITNNKQVKSHETPELKKTFHTFAQEFKEKVESYKPPLMKIKMQLNPGNLGDVDVTLINRGNNLHVNINSTPNTLALFIQNQAEFKNSLVNMGFTGLQMNFGENKDGQRGQNHKENNKNNHEHDDNNQEKDGFEMIVPRYV